MSSFVSSRAGKDAAAETAADADDERRRPRRHAAVASVPAPWRCPGSRNDEDDDDDSSRSSGNMRMIATAGGWIHPSSSLSSSTRISWCGGGATTVRRLVAMVVVCVVQLAMHAGRLAATRGGASLVVVAPTSNKTAGSVPRVATAASHHRTTASGGGLPLPSSAGSNSNTATSSDATPEEGWADPTYNASAESLAAAPEGSVNVEHCLLRTNSRAWLRGPRLGNAGEHFSPAYVERVLTEPLADGLLRLVEENEDDVNREDSNGSSNESTELLTMYLSQSLCHERSKFRDAGVGRTAPVDATAAAAAATATNDDTNEDPSELSSYVTTWTTRLIYLATIHHQHRHAREEALARYKKNPPGPDADDRERCDGARNPPELLANKYGVGLYDYETTSARRPSSSWRRWVGSGSGPTSAVQSSRRWQD